MWAGYNALTHWATHTDETIEKKSIKTVKSRLDRVNLRLMFHLYKEHETMKLEQSLNVMLGKNWR